MGIIAKLDELITSLDTPEAEAEAKAEESADELSEVENNPKPDIIETEDAQSEDVAEQVETLEDAADTEALEKLTTIVEKQQAIIDSLKSQMAHFIKDGANISDGKDIEPEKVPSNVPSDYEYLKDLDYTM